MERGVRARGNARGHRRQAQCRPERGAATARYRRAPQAAQRRVPREYARGVSRLRGGGNGEMGARGARGQYQAGIATTSVSYCSTFTAVNARRARELCAAKIRRLDPWMAPALQVMLQQHPIDRSARDQADDRPLLLDYPERPQDHDLPRGD